MIDDKLTYAKLTEEQKALQRNLNDLNYERERLIIREGEIRNKLQRIENQMYEILLSQNEHLH